MSETRPPVVHPSKIAHLRGVLLHDAILQHQLYGKPYAGDTRSLVCSEISTRLKCSQKVVQQSLEDLEGDTLTESVAHAALWRLAANAKKLRSGEPVPAWTGNIKDPEWVLGQILEVIREEEKSKTGEYYHVLRTRIMSGSPCSKVVPVTWSTKMIRYASVKIFGFSRGKNQDRKFRDPTELTNFRFFLEIDPEQTNPSQMGFRAYRCTPKLLSWNRELMDMRARIGFDCPHDYTHRCYQCHVGYMDCPVATHRQSY